HGLAGAVADEIAVLGGARPTGTDLKPLLNRAIEETRGRFDARHFVEIGIGCEACHLGSRAHAADPEVKPRLLPRSPFSAARPPPPPTRAELQSRACLRCHTVLFSGYPYTWEGARRGPDGGGSSMNSGEARDFILGGGCAKKLACTACHDPHGEDSRASLDALGTVAGNRVCASCHAERAPEHTKHGPESAGSACLACHMPKKNMGLALEMTRYHRIGSPTDEARALGDRPLECALCHVDKNAGQIAADIERLWGKRLPRERLR